MKDGKLFLIRYMLCDSLNQFFLTLPPDVFEKSVFDTNHNQILNLLMEVDDVTLRPVSSVQVARKRILRLSKKIFWKFQGFMLLEFEEQHTRVRYLLKNNNCREHTNVIV